MPMKMHAYVFTVVPFIWLIFIILSSVTSLSIYHYAFQYFERWFQKCIYTSCNILEQP